MSDLAYDRHQLADALGCSIWLVDKLTAEGRIPCVRLAARRTIYPKAQIAEWLADEARSSTVLAELRDSRGVA